MVLNSYFQLFCQLKDFILSQPEAYEIKIGDQLHQRPGDPPLDEIIGSLNREKSNNGMHDSIKDEF